MDSSLMDSITFPITMIRKILIKQGRDYLDVLSSLKKKDLDTKKREAYEKYIREPRHKLVFGHKGIGKTALTRTACVDIVKGPDSGDHKLEKGIHVVTHNDEVLKIYYNELHGGTLSPYHMCVASTTTSTYESHFTEKLIEQVHGADDVTRPIYQDKAKESFMRQLQIVLNAFLTEAINEKVDLILLLIQDMNKCEDAQVNNMIKSIMDRVVADHQLPLVYAIATGNPPQTEGYDNIDLDETVVTSSTMLMAECDDEAAINYLKSIWEPIGNFFATTGSPFLCNDDTRFDIEQGGIPVPRSWARVCGRMLLNEKDLHVKNESQRLENEVLMMMELRGDVGVDASKAFIEWYMTFDGKVDLNLINPEEIKMNPAGVAVKMLQQDNFDVSLFSQAFLGLSDEKFPSLRALYTMLQGLESCQHTQAQVVREIFIDERISKYLNESPDDHEDPLIVEQLLSIFVKHGDINH